MSDINPEPLPNGYWLVGPYAAACGHAVSEGGRTGEYISFFSAVRALRLGRSHLCPACFIREVTGQCDESE